MPLDPPVTIAGAPSQTIELKQRSGLCLRIPAHLLEKLLHRLFDVTIVEVRDSSLEPFAAGRLGRVALRRGLPFRAAGLGHGCRRVL